jgi:predicted nucleotidyltransferase
VSCPPGLDFTHLPALPQVETVKHVAEALWRCDNVRAIWLGGSLADGSADRYSDVDLRVAVTPASFASWENPDFDAILPAKVLAKQVRHNGDESVRHHLMLAGGEIVDIAVIPASREKPETSIVVLGCRDEKFAPKLDTFIRPTAPEHRPAQGDVIKQVICDFGLNTHKHRKVLNRGIALLALVGLSHERMLLTRLWYASITGLDAGDRRATIFELSHLCRTVQDAVGEKAMQVMGPPLGRRELIIAHIEQLRNEVSDVGRELAARLNFEYPEELEATVRRGWEEYLATAAAGR